MAKILTQAANLRKPFDMVLEQRQLLTREQILRHQQEARRRQISLEDLLCSEAVLPPDTVYESLADAFGLTWHSLEGCQIPDQLPARVIELCAKECLIPLTLQNGSLTVATFRPALQAAHASMLAAAGVRPVFQVCSPDRARPLLEALQKLTTPEEQDGGIDSLISSLSGTGEDAKGAEGLEISGVSDSPEAPSVVDLVNRALTMAVRQKASDIHVEATEKGLRVRFRLDGVLVHRFELAGPPAAAFISRILVMAGLDITEKLLPQDGSFKVRFEGRDVEFRIASIPGSYGQNLTLRLLSGQEVGAISLEKLGLKGLELEVLTNTIKFPHGMILVAGPTGSGKSTTLYAILERLANPAVKILTIEDPIERRINLVTQVQVRINRNDPARSLTFARGLRTFLRLDPDIIMVGEIRDQETAEIAVQASLTGHLVLSTVHANSSTETLRRLQNIGVDYFLFMSTLNLVIAQRLVRNLCPHCRTSRPPTPEESELFPAEIRPDILFQAHGCNRCFGTGYAGRVGIFEFLPVDDEIRDSIQADNLMSCMPLVRRRTLKTLRQSALIHVADGATDLNELERVCGPCSFSKV